MTTPDFDKLRGTIAVVGSMNADLTVRTQSIPAPGETVPGQPLKVLPGGKSANQAVCASLLGAKVSMIGAIGTDANSHVLRESFDKAGVDTTKVAEVDIATGTAIITVDDAGENSIVVSAGANGCVDRKLVNDAAAVIEAADVLGLCLEVDVDAVLAAAEIAHKAGTTVVFNLSPIIDVDKELWPLVDVLVVNEHELAHVLDAIKAASSADEMDKPGLKVPVSELSTPNIADCENDPHWGNVRDALLGFGIGSAVVTLGAAGSMILEREAITRICGLSVPVVDTTGCGDSYMATLLSALASGIPLAEGARYASYVSAYAACGEGAQNSYGTAQEITDFFANRT